MLTEPTTNNCLFCDLPQERIFLQDKFAIAIWDGYPVSPGHALIIPRRHTATWFDATETEHHFLLKLLTAAKSIIDQRYHPDGYNIGINSGAAAGQTVFHLHVHLIPRYTGDSADPRGGVRQVFPERANYLRDSAAEATAPYVNLVEAKTLWTGGASDPLMPQLKNHLSQAKAADILVAFTLRTGVEYIFPYLQDLLERKGELRILTGDYLGATDPDALIHLLDLQGNVQVRVVETGKSLLSDTQVRSFHPKAYLFRAPDGSCAAFIGSSNLSVTALTDGVEWNYRVSRTQTHAEWTQIQSAFDSVFTSPNTVALTAGWIEQYRRRRLSTVVSIIPTIEPDPPISIPTPHCIQAAALEALRATREAGEPAGLVVLATGLGKTWLSAFDSIEFKRVLFVAHRDEILTQAMSNYRAIRPHDSLGKYTGAEKSVNARVLFASIQTLSRQVHLDQFSPREFDYIVIDEFHHAEANTYRRLITYFKPEFMLGLTATPERSDGADLLSLCADNLVFRCDLAMGIREGLLCPFHYFGVPDTVDYRNIPWRSHRFDEAALTQVVATEVRSQNALEQYRLRAGKRTLAFCVSQRHADYMSAFFNRNGVESRSVHAGTSSAPRAESLELLKSGSLPVICVVDMFNEGVDVPELDTVMMLRPTESKIIFLQQLGRGLRRSKTKPHLTIIDYIGNHRSFLLKPQALFGLSPDDREVLKLLDQWDARISDLPPGCEVTYELEARDMLRQLLRIGNSAIDVLKQRYIDFRETLGVRPTAAELRREGYDPRALRFEFGSWLGFVESQGDMTSLEAKARAEIAAFLDDLEITPMTKSYKMLVLYAMLNRSSLPGSLSLQEVRKEIRAMSNAQPRIAQDLGERLSDDASLDQLIRDNPIDAWVDWRGPKGGPYFALSSNQFSSTFPVSDTSAATGMELIREVVDWRLADYFMRKPVAPVDGYILRVSHAGGKPILFLPQRISYPGLPEGWTQVEICNETVEANFVQIAVNVARRENSEENVLPELLTREFGSDAGKPGTRHQMILERTAGRWRLKPAGASGAQVTPYRTYRRAEIAPLFGFPYVENFWRQGFLQLGGNYFLMVTLDKSQHGAKFQYADRFLSCDRFSWQSQNRMRRDNKASTALAAHGKLGTLVHLFVRPKAKTKKGEGCPFYYCGRIEFVSWEGDNPITIEWCLREPVPASLWVTLGVPGLDE